MTQKIGDTQQAEGGSEDNHVYRLESSEKVTPRAITGLTSPIGGGGLRFFGSRGLRGSA